MGLTHLNAARPREKSSGVPHCGSSKILSDLVSHRRATRQVFDAAYIFPMGATAKPLEPTKLRPTDDHTRTGLNAACDMTGSIL